MPKPRSRAQAAYELEKVDYEAALAAVNAAEWDYIQKMGIKNPDGHFPADLADIRDEDTYLRHVGIFTEEAAELFQEEAETRQALKRAEDFLIAEGIEGIKDRLDPETLECIKNAILANAAHRQKLIDIFSRGEPAPGTELIRFRYND